MSQDLLQKGMEILNILGKEHGESVIVGGAVRDMFIQGSREAVFDDIDIATNVDMDKIEKLFPTHDIGKNKEFGVIVVEYGGYNFEIAQFRTDGEYSDGRRPDSIETGVNFKCDTQRRDFTINAMGMRKDRSIADYHGGYKDIQNKIIKTVGDPELRFSEDYLRMLRAVRFACRLDFTLENDTFDAISKHANKIYDISAERIFKELWKMAEQTGSKFADAIIMLKTTGLLYHILPEVAILEDMPHNPEMHPEGVNVFEHTMSALRVNNEPDPILNLALLLHDIGKTRTHEIVDGKHRYIGHEFEGADMVNEIADRLKFDNKLRDTLVYTTTHHMKMHVIKSMRKSKIVRLANDPNWEMLKKVSYCDDFCRGEELFDQADWNNKMGYANWAIQKYGESSHAFTNPFKNIVNGDVIMEVRDIQRPCKEIGIVLTKTVNWIIDNDISLDDHKTIKEFIKEYEVKNG
jgi:tRNA nucleotidyltransferase/poly(A) polymerase